VTAKSLIAALAYYISKSNSVKKEERNFSTLVKYVFNSSAFLFETHSNGNFIYKNGSHIYSEVSPFLNADIPEFSKKIIDEIIALPHTTKQCVLSFAQSYLRILSGTSILDSLKESTVSVTDIIEGKKLTIYIVIPPDKLASHNSLLRMWIGILLSAIMRRKGGLDQRTLFILDECAQLGNLESLKVAITLLREYGLQVWMFFQDLSQIYSIYTSDAKTIINNCAVFQAFGYTRKGAMDAILEELPDIDENELLTIRGRKQIVSIVGARKSKVLERAFYYEDALFKGKYDDNPRYKKRIKK